MLYVPDEKDRVSEEGDVPFPVPGAPLPSVLATEDRLLLSYYSEIHAPYGAPSKPMLVTEGFSGTVVIVDFRLPAAFASMALSNETLEAHPLAHRGLTSYRVFRVESSSWIRGLVAAQYVHARPFPGAFDRSRHYIFTFHDSVFEAIADGASIRSFPGSIREAQQEMLDIIRAGDR
jgi:hypothetical protein